MTAEEIKTHLGKICLKLDKLHYEAISDIFKHNNWKWGGIDEPEYYPEYRDLKRHIKKTFGKLVKNFLNEFTDNIPYLEQSSTSGRLRLTLIYDDNEIHLEIKLDSPLYNIDHELTDSYINDDVVEQND